MNKCNRTWIAFANKKRCRHNGSVTGAYVMDDMFDTSGNYFYPICRTTQRVSRNGWRNEFIKMNLPVEDIIKQLLVNPVAETIVKQGQMDVFKYMLRKGNYQLPYQHTLNICHRNGYVIEDASLWFEYMDLLVYFHLDTRNARYVCPVNLKAEHDRLLSRKRRVEERVAIKKKMAEAEKWEKEYRENKGKYFGVCFGNENVVITVSGRCQRLIDRIAQRQNLIKAREKKELHALIVMGRINRVQNELLDLLLVFKGGDCRFGWQMNQVELVFQIGSGQCNPSQFHRSCRIVKNGVLFILRRKKHQSCPD